MTGYSSVPLITTKYGDIILKKKPVYSSVSFTGNARQSFYPGIDDHILAAGRAGEGMGCDRWERARGRWSRVTGPVLQVSAWWTWFWSPGRQKPDAGGQWMSAASPWARKWPARMVCTWEKIALAAAWNTGSCRAWWWGFYLRQRPKGVESGGHSWKSGGLNILKSIDLDKLQFPPFR